MLERRPKAPLLVTRCDDCLRHRACYPMPARRWVCKLCIVRVCDAGLRALDAFLRQGR